MSTFWYYFWAVLFVLIDVAGLAANLLTLPGNWIIAAATVVFALFIHHPNQTETNWWCIGLMIGLALVGELIEFAAGAAGAAKTGGSRRGMILAVAGAMVCSILGTGLGTFLPIPVIGNLVGAIAGGAAGAFGGAYLGESWKGRSENERLTISAAAMVGRVFGTVGKFGVGAIMVVVFVIYAYAFVN